ncbi:GNAT family N-acetyltransferase [Amycolatopsis sp. NPDC003731]
MIGSAVRSGARGEFGALVPIRPAVKDVKTCLRGHWLNLDLYDKLAPFSQRYRLHGWLCEVCRGQEACEPYARRLAEWALLDVTVQHRPDAAPTNGLVMVVHPPATATLAGRIELRLDGTEVGSVTASPCGRCRTATLDYVHVVVESTGACASVARWWQLRWLGRRRTGGRRRCRTARWRGRSVPGSPCVEPVRRAPTSETRSSDDKWPGSE